MFLVIGWEKNGDAVYLWKGRPNSQQHIIFFSDEYYYTHFENLYFITVGSIYNINRTMIE